MATLQLALNLQQIDGRLGGGMQPALPVYPLRL